MEKKIWLKDVLDGRRLINRLFFIVSFFFESDP